MKDAVIVHFKDKNKNLAQLKTNSGDVILEERMTCEHDLTNFVLRCHQEAKIGHIRFADISFLKEWPMEINEWEKVSIPVITKREDTTYFRNCVLYVPSDVRDCEYDFVLDIQSTGTIHVFRVDKKGSRFLILPPASVSDTLEGMSNYIRQTRLRRLLR